MLLACVRSAPRPTNPFFLYRGNEHAGVLEWAALPERVVCDEIVYRQLAHFIQHEYEYKFKAGEMRSLALLTQKKYVRNLVWDAYFRYKGGPYKAFFECLDEKNRSSWLRGMEARIERSVTSAAILSGVKVVTSSVPLHLVELDDVNRAYSLHASTARHCIGDASKKMVRLRHRLSCVAIC